MKTIDTELLVRNNIRDLLPYTSAREEYKGSAGIFLDANESPYGTHNRYPDPRQRALKQRLSEINKLKPEQLFLGNGSDELIDLAFRIFCEPQKDKALTFTPTYGMYEVAAAIHGVLLTKVPLDKEFQIDQELTKPFLSDKNLKLIFICSPNNPTGNLLRKADVEFVLQNFHGIVVIDEAYIDFSGRPSFAKQLARYPHLIVLQTLSKAWALAGVRLGLAWMHEALLVYFNKVKYPYNISELNQQTALQALNDVEAHRLRVNMIVCEKQRVTTQLQRLKLVQKIYPSDANFLLVEFMHAESVYEALTKQHIVVRNRSSVIPNCLRISIGTPEENQKLLTALQHITHD